MWFSFLATLIAWGILGSMNQWSRYGAYAVVLGDLALFLIIDRIVKSQLHCMLRKKFSSVWMGTADDALPKSVITQSDVDQILQAMAESIQLWTDEQHRIANEAKASPNDSYQQAHLRVINDWVAGALKDFWRAHWLARIFGYKMMPRWKDYLPAKSA
ncbi:hypothetical protein KKG41_04300 [Patescibacteria group bacterium]|nr:hypothetical protein [Patescibacteria group bacterium]MBU1890714.1 hypothetical protein [Patescibacteria group bacterium]